MTNKELIIGSHVAFSSKEQLLGSVKEALSYNANTFMFYTGAPQNTKRLPINDELTYEAYKLMKENNIDLSKVIIHAPYIVNLGNLENFDFSVSFLKGEVERASMLGIKYMVLHPGASVSYSKEESINSIIKGLNLILDNDKDVVILLETMAGKGTEIGRTFEEIAEIIDKVQLKDHIGVCLDTCHVYDAGYDIVNDLDGVLEEFDKIIGLEKLCAVHLNDSKNPFNSHKDRHETIGNGNIGLSAMFKIVNHPLLQGLPFCLETPNDADGYKKEIQMLRENINS